jgi:hypothetical protein
MMPGYMYIYLSIYNHIEVLSAPTFSAHVVSKEADVSGMRSLLAACVDSLGGKV